MVSFSPSLSFLCLVSLLIATAVIVVKAQEKVPVIFDNDANYDDTLALMYLLTNPMFDVVGITTAGAGFATYHGGPINMQHVAQLFDQGGIPVSYGKPTSLTPISTFPLSWRIEIDQFFQDANLPPADTPLSVYQSDKLISKILKESDTAVAVVVTGPGTNLALALQDDPTLVDRISGLFLMGSNYGGGPNNVYDWQMTFNGIVSSCSEDATSHAFTPVQRPLTLTLPEQSTMRLLVGKEDIHAAGRPGCRGNSMSKSGNTEWNVFLDALSWHVITRFVAESKSQPPIYVITSGATEDMPIDMPDFDEGIVLIDDKKVSKFIHSLAEAFLGAGEAKWWDAQLVVAMADIIAGVPLDESVCSEWLSSDGFKVNLDWKSVPYEDESGTLNPYGSITDIKGIGPNAEFCRHGNVTNMKVSYWTTLAGENTEYTIADPDVYLRALD